jgi:L-fuculose-phosphate aldolase
VIPREQAGRAEIVRIGRLMYDKGFVVATDGNLSVRLGPERILCTPSGLCKGFMQPEQLIVVDAEGRRAGSSTPANRNLQPTSEMAMHLQVYRRRPDVMAVLHAHPPLTVALSIAGVSLAQCMVPEVIVTLGLIPTTCYATPSSQENAEAIRELIAGHDALVLQRHGTLTVGRDPFEAYLKLETVERCAQIALCLHQLGGHGQPLPPAEVSKLLATREALGYSRPGDAEEFCRQCGVCARSGRP